MNSGRIIPFARTVRLLAVAALALCCFGPSPAQSPISISNREFEVPTIPTSAQNQGSLNGWTLNLGNNVDVVRSYWQPAKGFQSLDLNGTAPAVISQLISVVPGRNYRLRFAMAANPDSPGVKTMQVAVANAFGDFNADSTGHTATNMGWSYKTLNFVGPAPTTNLVFASTTAGASGPALDDISVRDITGVNVGPWPIDFSEVNATNGFLMTGEQQGAALGNCVVGAGDVNGDGYEDMLISHHYHVVGSNDGAGEVYLVFGGPQAPGHGGDFDFSELNGLNGVRFQGYATFSEVSPSMSGIGDFNGDGYADIAIGAEYGFTNNNGGEIAVIYGRPVITGNEFGTNGIYDLTNVGTPGNTDVRLIDSNASDYAGHSVSGAGDIDNDGYEDLLIGAPGYNSQKGRVFVVYGSPNKPVVTDLNNLNGANGGATVYVAAGTSAYAGNSVSGVGDVNADGFDDVLVGARDDFSGEGSAALIYGKASRIFDLAQTPTNRSIIRSNTANARMGNSVAGLGDFNGDGIDDFIVGASQYNSNRGTAALVFGSASGIGGAGTLDTRGFSGLTGTNGINLDGWDTGTFAGTSVGGAGDVNGDGYTDLLFNVPDEDPIVAGATGSVYVMYGNAQPNWTGHASISRSEILSTYGHRIIGTLSGMKIGSGLSTVGDFNRDGLSDLGIGAEGYINYQGQAALILSPFTAPASVTYSSYSGPGNDVQPSGKVVPPKPVGFVASGKMTHPFSMCKLGFKGGGRNSGSSYTASKQTVIYRRSSVPAPNSGGTYRVAGVNWNITSADREDFNQATIVLYYQDSQLAGLNPSKADIWYTPDTNPTANSVWSPLGATRDPVRRTFSATRLLSGTGTAPRTAFNGTYTIMDVDLTYDLGSQIMMPGTVDANALPPTGPEVIPADSAVWVPSSKKLIAVKTGGVQVNWKKVDQSLMATTVASLQWPLDTNRYQYHIANTPPISLSDYQFSVITQTETNANAQAVQDNKLFSATTPGRTLLHLAPTPGADPFFQLVWTQDWKTSTVLTETTAEIAKEIVPPGGVHNPACGGPFVMNAVSKYCAASNTAGYYDRATRTGPIFPVNTDEDGNTNNDLAIAYYQKGSKLISGASLSFTSSNVDWPYHVYDYKPQWPTSNVPTIVIASQLGAGTLVGPVFANWKLYFENDPTKPGFNPNDEHAVVGGNKNGDNTVMPIRSDLGTTSTSQAYVLITYQDQSVTSMPLKMRAYKVEAENSTFKFFKTVVAGKPILPILPLATLNFSSQTVAIENNQANSVGFKDRKFQMWALRGKDATDATTPTVDVEFYYPALASFYFPPGYPAPPAGKDVPLLDLYAKSLGGLSGHPVHTKISTKWPTDAPVLHIGESLVKPKNGLPSIFGQCSVGIIYQEAAHDSPTKTSVRLIDPVKLHVQSMGALPDGIRTEQDGAVLRFPDLPPHIASRVSYKPINTTTGELRLEGIYTEPALGDAYIVPNVLAPSEVNAVKNLKPGNASWAQAIDALVAAAQADLDFTTSDTEVSPYVALSAGNATGAGYVTLAMQNSGPTLCDPNLPVSLEVIHVDCPVFRGVATVLEPNCVFDERLTMKHSGDFAGNPDDYIFEWRTQPDGGSDDDTTTPTLAPVLDSDPVSGWNIVAQGPGAVTYSIGGASPLTLSDNWFICRYKPKNASAIVCSDNNSWSQWTPPKLAPGWIKRVLAGIGPFEQRFKQLSDPSKTINTTVDMISQAGPRWEGSVPLNCSAVDDFGLIEIYETVYRRGIDLSIGAGINYQPANNALLLIASRISDLYMLLGNEAFADASDPTIGILGDSPNNYIAAGTSMHAFADLAQTPTLLDEELALLRGRDNNALPPVTTPPIYNRLPWNFSGGLGEVAYQLNYDIRDSLGNYDGHINEIDAKKIYPQGHGDAWGHYLTAVADYYRLLRDPFFVWVPRSEVIQIGGGDVTVDYQEEQRFARAAAAKARTGAEIVNLTYRSRYVENPTGQYQGYKDTDQTRAWGLSEWASRTGQGAYFDWVTANAVLPEASDAPPPSGKLKIDRGTVTDLPEIASAYTRIQTELDNADQGLNPLGLEKNVMPFDISPSDIDAGKTHFEQIYDRSILAISSAVTTFNNALNNTQKLRQQSDDLSKFQTESVAQERDYQSRLIEVFGQPYAEDIGPSGTYPTGYKGPDIYHYLYEDNSALLGITPTASDLTQTVKTYTINFTKEQFDFTSDDASPLKVMIDGDGVLQTAQHSVTFNYTPANGFIKPSNWTARLASGEIQNARSELLQQQGNFKIALSNYTALLDNIEDRADLIKTQYAVDEEKIHLVNTRNNTIIGLNTAIATAKTIASAFEAFSEESKKTSENVAEAFPLSAGLSFDATAPLRSAVKIAGAIVGKVFKVLALSSEAIVSSSEAAKEGVEQRTELEIEELQGSYELTESIHELQTMIRDEETKRYELYVQTEVMNQTAQKFVSAMAKGERLLDEFVRFRLETSAAIQGERYKNMAYRVFRNDALQKYRAQFDLAARYCYLAARAYDYETNFKPGDQRRAGEEFLNQIVHSRALGRLEDNNGDGIFNPVTGSSDGDPGLADALAQMKANWDLVIKGQLGFNNPQLDRVVLSLRYDNWQLVPNVSPPTTASAAGDVRWRQRLNNVAIKVPNLLSLPDFNRYCIPFAPRQAVEPGLVIPFSTTINSGQNVFGNPLVANQQQFDSSKFATKIRKVAVLFDNLNNSGVAAQPPVYLIPIGLDTMRTPSDPQNIQTRSWRLLDQVLPVPFLVTQGNIASPSWIPSINALNGQIGSLRRYSQFKAYNNDATILDSEFTANSRLVGRSAWNDQWLLIIPGASLLSDRNEGIERFINGQLSGNQRSGNGVKDIKIVFDAYAYSGN